MTRKLPTLHAVYQYEGPPRACGRQYGGSQAEAIEAFLHQEVPPDRQRLRYARRCWERISRWEKHVADFVQGMAEGSKLSIDQVTLLVSHEEIVHTKPCTAIGATGTGTVDGTAIIGQNWDWNPSLYPWPSLTRLHARGIPRAFLYSYPGLWASAGINEHGLSLVWTGAGYLPKIKPIVGIPTYAITAGILACRDCREAVALLRRTTNAGCFIFFLADARKEVWVIEGLPGRIEAIRCQDTITRGNHYEDQRTAHLARQDLFCNPLANTRFRGPRMAALARRYAGRIDRHVVERCLRDEGVGPGRNICQQPSGSRRGLTIDSFYCLPSKREFWIARGLQTRHEYRRYRV